MKKLRDLCLEVLLKEGEDIDSIRVEDIDRVLDVDFNSEDIRIEFVTTYNKTMSLIIKNKDFNQWISKNKSKYNNIFKNFLIDFLSNSTEGGEELNEIVDDNGEIMGDEDMPINATNSLVKSPRFDLEKIYKSFIPKSIRFFSGSMGVGSIVW